MVMFQVEVPYFQICELLNYSFPTMTKNDRKIILRRFMNGILAL